MASRARFPGRPVKNTSSRQQISSFVEPKPSTSKNSQYETTTKKLDVSDYQKIASQTATNLKAFRALFGTSEEEDEVLIGFKPNGKLAKACKKKLIEVKKEIKSLEAQLKGLQPNDSKGAQIHNIPNSKQNGVSAEIHSSDNEERFSGFNDNDPRIATLKKRKRAISEEIMVLSESDFSGFPKRNREGIYMNQNSDVFGTKYEKPNLTSSDDDSANCNASELQGASTSRIRQRAESRIASHAAGQASSDSECDNLLGRSRQGNAFGSTKSLNNHFALNDKSHCVKEPPIVNGHGNHNGINEKKFQELSPYVPIDECNGRSAQILPECIVFTDNEDLDYGPCQNEEILLDRQGRRIRRKRRRQQKLIRSIGSFDFSDKENEYSGFPVILDSSVGVLPPKPLCFLCGSCGIEQLIFCSSCCEPFHPYCTNDQSLLSLFVARSVPRPRPHQEIQQNSCQTDELLRSPIAIPVYYTDVSNPIPSCVKNLSNLLSPPLTPSYKTPDKIEDDLLKYREREMVQYLMDWTCHRCTKCKQCDLNQKKDRHESKNEFVKCWKCRCSFHVGCIQKKLFNKEKWECDICLKCHSCGKRIEGKTFEINSEADYTNGDSRNVKLLLCKDCVRKRHKGSFCPLCNCCYDDDDYDTRMMECASCNRWTHAACEGLSEEGYQILSSLPESVDYVCRLCGTSGKPEWRKAINIELMRGFETILRIFQKKALTTSRKHDRTSLIQNCKKTSSTAEVIVEQEEDAHVVFEPITESCHEKEIIHCDVQPKKQMKNLPLVILNDFIKNPETFDENIYQRKRENGSKSNGNLDLPSILAREVLLTMNNTNQLTPLKKAYQSDLERISDLAFSPTKCVTSFVDSHLNSSFQERKFSSVLEFNDATREFIESTFAYDERRMLSYQRHFTAALKEIFPWFDSDAIRKSELRMVGAGTNVETKKEGSHGKQDILKEVGNEILQLKQIRDLESDGILLRDPFGDVYWNDNEKKDLRKCAFCHVFGDSSPDFCGRLLWAGLNEWVHVNCALWSSEVWEGETGLLHQVGVALSRSKTIPCGVCKQTGASLGCCYAHCPNSFHFPCALNSNCYMTEDNHLYCPAHIKKAKGEVQRDMEVMRRVFIDPDFIRKREKLARSSDLRIFIGSLRVDNLGQILPISTREFIGPDIAIIPAEYSCTRLFWSSKKLNQKICYSICSTIHANQPDDFTHEAKDILNLVVDHSKNTGVVSRRLRQVNDFCIWVDTCPIYLDEEDTIWFPSCPFGSFTRDVEVEDGNEADIEDNNNVKDIEVQTSFSSCSTRGSSLSASPQNAEDETDLLIFHDCLTPDAMQQLYAEGIGIDSEEDFWSPAEAYEPDCISSVTNKNSGTVKQLSRLPSSMFLQIDGAVNYSSDSDSSSSVSSEPEKASSSGSDESRNTRGRLRKTSEEPLRRGRSATSSENANAGRILRSRQKLPERPKKEESKCPHCKRGFQSTNTVSRHMKSCKSKSKSKTSKVKESNLSSKSMKRKLEPPSSKKAVETKEKDVPIPTTSGSARECMLARTARKQAMLTPKRDSDDFESSGQSSDEKGETKEDSSVKVLKVDLKDCERLTEISKLSCPKCHNTYRTEESLKKHIAFCTALSSSGEESFEDELQQTPSQSYIPEADNEEAICVSTSESDHEGVPQESIAESKNQMKEQDLTLSTNIIPSVLETLQSEEVEEVDCSHSRRSIDSNIKDDIVSLAETNNDLSVPPVFEVAPSYNTQNSYAGTEDINLKTVEVEGNVSTAEVGRDVISYQIYEGSDQSCITPKQVIEAHPTLSLCASVHDSFENIQCTNQLIPEPGFSFHQQVPERIMNMAPTNSAFHYAPPETNKPHQPLGISEESCQPVVQLPTPVNSQTGFPYSQNMEQVLAAREMQKHAIYQSGSLALEPRYTPLSSGDNQMSTVQSDFCPQIQNFQNLLIHGPDGQLISARVQIPNQESTPEQANRRFEARQDLTPIYQHQFHSQEPSRPNMPMFIQAQQQQSHYLSQQLCPQKSHQVSHQFSQQFPSEIVQQFPPTRQELSSQLSQQDFDSRIPHRCEFAPQQIVPQQLQHPQTPFSGPLLPQSQVGLSQENVTYVIMQQDPLPSVSSQVVNRNSNELAGCQQFQQVFQQHQCTPTQTILPPKVQQPVQCGVTPFVQASPVINENSQVRLSNATETSSPMTNIRSNSHCSCLDCQNRSNSTTVSAERIKIVSGPKKLPGLHTTSRPVLHRLDKVQTSRIMSKERPGQRILLRPGVRSSALPKLLPATITQVPLSPQAPLTLSMNTSLHSFSRTVTSNSLPNPIVASSVLPGKASASNPNIAVVRPMEHPLMSIQKMSEQIHQINSFPRTTAIRSCPPVPAPASTLSAQISIPPTTLMERPRVANQMFPVAQNVVDSALPSPQQGMATALHNPLANPTETSTENKSKVLIPDPDNKLPGPPLTSAESSAITTVPSASKSEVSSQAIKMTLKRKEGEDSYSINSVSAPESQITGKLLRNLKVKGKITSGKQAGTLTDAIVEPIVHIVPIPNESEENRTICEDPTNSRDVSFPQRQEKPKIERLTHKAVIVYRVKCNDVELFQSSDVRTVWSQVLEAAQGKRLSHNLPPLSYPATSVSLPDNKFEAASSFNQLGLKHRAVQFLLEQLPGVNSAAKSNHDIKSREGSSADAEDSTLTENPSGCARNEGFHERKPFDMFGWLASKQRKPLSLPALMKSSELSRTADLPIAMKFRNLNKAGSKHLQVYWSVIHGRGLFTTKDIECGEMIIEYAGELIRHSVCDIREKYYESKGIGCYMFKIGENYVVDATMKGNAARFINHSCDPNCRSKITEVFGKKRILIFALRKIQFGEELTYDYKFPYEDVKIPCRCGAAKCKKYLN